MGKGGIIMTGEEIVGIVITSIFGGILLVLWVWMLVLMLKDNFRNMPTKKKQIKELKTEVEKLKEEIEVLNFKLDNPKGKRVKQTWYGDWQLQYLDNNSIRYYPLPYADCYEIKNNYIVDDKGNKYKFDVDNEILIKIEKK